MARYVVDAGRSKLTVQVSAGGILSAFGHSPAIAMSDMDGEASFDSDAPERTEIVFRVRPAKLAVLDDIPQNERNEIEHSTRNQVLQTDRFPEVRFESDRVEVRDRGPGRYRFDISGSLMLHGQRSSQVISALVEANKQSLLISGEARVLQSAFGIPRFSAVGGTLKVKDEVNLLFEIVARRDSPE